MQHKNKTKQAAFFKYSGTLGRRGFDRDPKGLGKSDKSQKLNYVNLLRSLGKWNLLELIGKNICFFMQNDEEVQGPYRKKLLRSVYTVFAKMKKSAVRFIR